MTSPTHRQIDTDIRIAELEMLNAAHVTTIESLNKRLPEFAELHRCVASLTAERDAALDRNAELTSVTVNLYADVRNRTLDLNHSHFHQKHNLDTILRLTRERAALVERVEAATAALGAIEVVLEQTPTTSISGEPLSTQVSKLAALFYEVRAMVRAAIDAARAPQ